MDNLEAPVEFNGQIITMGQLLEMQKQQLEQIASGLVRMRDEWVAHRASSGVEARWTKNRKLYLGEDVEPDNTMMSVARNGPRAQRREQIRSKIVVNIVRPKVDQAIARMCEILLPTDEQNWEIRPTPVPETVSKRVGDFRQTVDPATGQPTGVTADDEAQAIIEEVRERATRMSDRIADHLTECDFNTQCRKGIEDGVILGSMVLKGPRPGKEIAKVWQAGPGGQSTMVIKQKMVPGTEAVDPWNVWFDPSCGNDHQRGRGVWHLRRVTRKELRQLVGLPGYDAEAIRSVLQSPPKHVKVVNGRCERHTPREDLYELWEYHGEVEPEEFEALSSRGGDPIEDVSFGVILMVNDTPISAIPSWIADGSLPYHVWNWRAADDSPYGYGLPDEIEHQQRAVNASWRMVMDNGRAALGPQIVVKRKLISPADGDPTITPFKLWEANPELEDVRAAFAVFDFPSHLGELMAIADKAMQFVDFETSMPQLMNGNQGTGPAPETVGGMVMLYNNANTVLRLKVKQFDDRITRPHIRQYYDYLMANDPDPSIKGDFEIDARGSAALIERDIQNQATLNLAAITANPRYAPHMKEREELKAILKAFKFNPEQLMRTDQEMEAAQQNAAPPPPDPRIVAAEMGLKAKEMEIADRKEDRQFEIAMRQDDNQIKRETLAYNAERERAQGEQARRQQDQQAELAIIKMQQDGVESAQERESRERMQKMQTESKHQLFNAEAALRVRTGEGI